MPKSSSSSLSAFERVRLAIELKKTDRVPVVPEATYVLGKLLNVKFSEISRSAEKMAKVLILGQEEIGYDGIYVGWESSFNLVAEAMGSKMRTLADGVPSIEDNLVKQESDLGKVKIPNPQKDGRLPIHLQATEIIRKNVGADTPIFTYVPGPLTLSGILRKTDLLMMDLLKNPSLVHDLNKMTTEASKAFALAKIEKGADIVVAADPTASTTMISPKMFEEFSLPYLKELLGAISKAGATPSLHICGQTTPILENMLETGPRILELDSQVDLREAKSRVGSKVCIQGNLNPTGALLRGSTDDVLKEAKECINRASMGGGYILSSGCEIPYEARIENLKALVRAAKTFGKYS
ncbi:MAG: uroporphyrinogen decarboxylase family protein [Promethearchaeati archaeon SRVP18_Atabeyarchaeia-1]